VTYISAIETGVPEYKHSQKVFSEFYARSTADTDIQRKIKIIGVKTGIESRYSVLKDFSIPVSDFEFFATNESLLPEPSLTRRMDIYNHEALKLSIQTILKIENFESIKSSITHIITVTCTGLMAPGLDIQLVQVLQLNPKIDRCSINFMGCNAAILALKQADTICKSDINARVLVVCTELCSIHFQKNYSDDYIVSNQLFGDGCAAVLIEASSNKFQGKKLIQLNGFHSLLLHQGQHDMAWQLSETGFKMNLTSYVSDLINGNIKAMLHDIDLHPEDIDLWAIHPGGKKIIDGFCEALNLKADKLQSSYDVLRDYGNMSSPTVLFVLKDLLEKNTQPTIGQSIFAAAFGPGLSIETLKLVYA
jgi:alpha-pyrone synthase